MKKTKKCKNNSYKIVIVIICLFALLKVKNSLDLKREIRKYSNEVVSFTSEVNAYLEAKKVFNEFNDSIDEVNRTYDKTKYEEIKNDVLSLEDSTLKETLIARLNSLENTLKEYDRKKSLLDSNPDRSVGITLNKSDVEAIETISGNVTAFTPYCGGGCNGYTASGIFVGNNIFYEDKEYGTVRIVAADSSYPFGTIVRFKNLSYFGEDVYAIVLDRGSMIGKNKWALFDLLFISETNANDFGVQKSVVCDILRLGY